MIAAGEEKRRRYRESGWWGDKSFADLFAANAAAYPDRPALIDAPNRADFAFGAPQRLTYADLAAEIDRLAGALVAAGIGKDDVLMVQLPNISEFVALYFAAAKIGAIVSPAAVQYRSHELVGMIGIVRPKAFICATQVKGSDHVAVVRPLLDDIALMTFGPDAPIGATDLSQVSGNAQALAAHVAANPVDADDIFTICWTSGTTGVPKGVPRSHNHWIAVAAAGYEAMKVGPGDVLLNPFPLINMASIGGITMCWLTSAGTMVLHHPFDPGIYLMQIATERPSLTIAPPAVLNMLLQNEELLARIDLSSLRVIASGSAPLAPAMVRGFQEKLGIIIVNVFGSNEGMSYITGEGDMPDPERRASLFPRRGRYIPPYGGERAPNIESRLVPPGGGDPIEADGVSGELQIRGPSLFEGYYDAPDRTAEAFTDDGWFRTGDLFEIAENGDFYRFVGRCKDLIIRGGVNISPEEIDQLLGGHPHLAEACTFSLPDPTMGERIGLAYVPRGDADVGLDTVTSYLRDKDLAVFKLPERLFRFDALPRNVTNKVMRSEVREMALKSMTMEG
ncbi:MAG: class I adenylate-forming enzyme family protein [Sphingopyxis sp.]|uniref:class I adenylate-forming enzyme family protein n=1 Tax=Sphingopyxis sp. TaxID=1908224 RepID=UPI002ABB7E99|nr:class I adenylate-forming enzyme family protein [Sphingopyxis sp.]MDZ3831602.1 class I adenylate-forming enzyme family protein [Sphingopyxis sp.]